MTRIEKTLSQLAEPQDYFRGLGKYELPSPNNILIFSRLLKEKLQQEAPQNRSHHRFVLIFNFETKGQIQVDHLSLPFCPGQFLLIHPYQFHHFSQLTSPKLKWMICTFELDASTFLEPLRNRVLHISMESIHARNALLEEWCRSLNPVYQSEMQEAKLQTALLHLLIGLKIDQQRVATDSPPESKDNLIRTINRLMAEWHGQTVTITSLAKELKCSESQLRTLFKNTAGIPLGSYIQNYRINRAMALLRTTSLSIADVSEQAGFGSPQAFSRTFKKETGHTPHHYRNR